MVEMQQEGEEELGRRLTDDDLRGIARAVDASTQKNPSLKDKIREFESVLLSKYADAAVYYLVHKVRPEPDSLSQASFSPIEGSEPGSPGQPRDVAHTATVRGLEQLGTVAHSVFPEDQVGAAFVCLYNEMRKRTGTAQPAKDQKAH